MVYTQEGGREGGIYPGGTQEEVYPGLYALPGTPVGAPRPALGTHRPCTAINEYGLTSVNDTFKPVFSLLSGVILRKEEFFRKREKSRKDCSESVSKGSHRLSGC